ncbi:tetratricopeptide repeat protein [Seohaeicola saemankumensis]|uniref:Tetratricopeptide repeat protein n=1 Tax=Seohaeicola saemankumensis TaxID=481181 RepID=A0ABW3TES3_9RHOB
MSQSESFIEEVTEEVRRDRMFGLMRRYGWIAVLLVLVLVGSAAWNEWRKAQAQAQAQAMGDAMIAALEADDSAARVAALQAIAAPDTGMRVVRDFTAAAEMIETGDTEGARALLSAIASDGAVDPAYRQMAGFKALLLQSDSLDLAERRLGFEGIAQTSAMLRLPAEEQLALIEIEEGQTDAAIARLQRLQADAEATAGLRQRASQLIVALGGTLDGTGAAGN